MKRSNHTTYRVGLAVLGLLTLLLAPRASALAASSAATFTLLHTFSSLSGSNSSNTDGACPQCGLILGSDGCFYGTARNGGVNGCGTVFKITPAGSLTTLYSFSGTLDGENPYGALLRTSDGSFYGTTYGGGVNGYGTVFKMSLSGSTATLTWSYPFNPGNGTDGANPLDGLIQGIDGNLYGTTLDFTVFKITPSGAESTLYEFSGTDGGNPWSSLVQDKSGNFYGTAEMGGNNGQGTVFKITSTGTLVWSYQFTGADGKWPKAALVAASDGNFYGTTWLGGANSNGAIFKITPSGTFTTLYSFTPLDANGNNADGALPYAGLIQGSDGSFYGAAVAGGAGAVGTVFKVATDGTAAGTKLTTIYSFSARSAAGDNADGAGPTGLLQTSDGSLYGTAGVGGANGYGTIFKLTVPGVGPSAGSTYALWNHSGQASLWKIPASGSTTSASFGPYAGWTPAGLASDTSGNAYILWTSTTGAASVWKLSSSLTQTTSQSFGPYTGWSAKSLAVGPDGNVHLLWNGPNNAASIFNVVLGTSSTSKGYGPFTGWQAQQIAVDSNNNTRVLWTNSAAYEASLWNITSAGVQTSQSFGPYSGWQAQSLAVGSDNLARMLWEQTSTKQASIFTVASSGSFTSKALGPYTGWTPTGLAVNKDGDSDLMWTSTSNALSLFDIGSTGSFTSSGYGPYSGWAPVAIAAGP